MNSSNKDVRLWLYHCFQQNDASISENDAWELAQKVNGTGDIVLGYSIEDWKS